MSDALDPLRPHRAIDMYLRDREADTSRQTRATHDKRLRRFADWLESEGVENLNEVDGRLCRRYRVDSFDEKEDGGEYSGETVRGYMDTLRVFLRFCVSIDAVESDVPDKVQSPRPGHSRDAHISPETAEKALNYLTRFKYATVQHVSFLLAWRTGLRLGGLRALDVNDVHLDDGYLKVQHRPPETPLKNKKGGEREVALREDTCEVLRDYIGTNRPPVTDPEERRPLLASRYGRRHKSNLRSIITGASRPCRWGGCPHDRDPEMCDAAQNIQQSYGCPSSVSPHDVRRGAITHHLRSDMPQPMVSDRFDVSNDVLEKHYDERTEGERRQQRAAYLPE